MNPYRRQIESRRVDEKRMREIPKSEVYKNIKLGNIGVSGSMYNSRFGTINCSDGYVKLNNPHKRISNHRTYIDIHSIKVSTYNDIMYKKYRYLGGILRIHRTRNVKVVNKCVYRGIMLLFRRKK